jgi:hypothetical protein
MGSMCGCVHIQEHVQGTNATLPGQLTSLKFKNWFIVKGDACNPSYREAESRRIMVQGQPRKLARPPSQPTSQVWWCTFIIPAM